MMLKCRDKFADFMNKVSNSLSYCFICRKVLG